MECHIKDNTTCIKKSKASFDPICRGCRVFIEVLTNLTPEAHTKIESDRRIADGLREDWKQHNNHAERYY